MSTFGRAWKEFRQKNRLTLREVSELIGLSVGYICDIESDRKGPPDLNIVKHYSKIVSDKDFTLVTLASKLKTKLSKDVTQPLQKNPRLTEILCRMAELTDEDLETISSAVDSLHQQRRASNTSGDGD